MLITPAYRDEQRALHEREPGYGSASVQLFPLILKVIRAVDPTSLLDYGAGKQRLKAKLQEAGLGSLDYMACDPAYPEYGSARPADMVCCIDVLEHVEPECVEDVVAELAAVTRRICLATIHTGPARKTLSDGRNAHLIQQPSSWWLPQVCQRFDVVALGPTPGGFYMELTPL